MKNIIIVLSLLITSPLLAQGNVEAGKKKSTICAVCHGKNGISSNPIWPNLAGQHASYTIQQLKDFKAGTVRNSPSMAGMVANLSNEDMADLAAYYQQLPLAKGVASKENLKRGETLYRGGDFKKGITACIACHGPQGLGNGEAKFPVVSGQHAPYMVMELLDFKNGTRKTDFNGIMRSIASRMSKEDMEAVANYMQGLH